MVGFCLFADQSYIQFHVDLFEDGMSKNKKSNFVLTMGSELPYVGLTSVDIIVSSFFFLLWCVSSTT